MMERLLQASQFKLSLSEAQQAQFEQYLKLILEWNQRVNLTRITDPDDIIVKHFLDSLSIYPALPQSDGPISLIDVGSGGGFPGIPLKIAQPDLQLTLLESTGKKTAFLTHVVTELELTQTEVLTSRAEDAARLPQHRQRYDVATARAVGKLPTLVEYLLPFVKIGGIAIAQKGQSPQEELDSARWAIGTLGGKSPRITPITVPGLAAERHLIVIPKSKPTPKTYPRRAGLPKKEPLLPQRKKSPTLQ